MILLEGLVLLGVVRIVCVGHRGLSWRRGVCGICGSARKATGATTRSRHFLALHFQLFGFSFALFASLEFLVLQGKVSTYIRDLVHMWRTLEIIS